MYYGDDGKFYLEPEIEGYTAYFNELDSTDAILCLDPEGCGPFFLFSTNGKYGQDKSAMLDGMIVLMEAARTLTNVEKQTIQIFFITNDNVYKCRDGNTKLGEYFSVAKKAPVRVEFCMN